LAKEILTAQKKVGLGYGGKRREGDTIIYARIREEGGHAPTAMVKGWINCPSKEKKVAD